MIKSTIISCAFLSLVLSTATAMAQKDHPLESRITGTVSLENWQQTRGYGLRNFEKITRDLMSANAENIRELKVVRDYAVSRLPLVNEMIQHDAIDSIVILKGNEIVYESYGNGVTPRTQHMCMSSTKTSVNLLVGKAVADGKLDLSANVEKYIPEIGSGYRGHTVADVLAMNVYHEFDEFTAYNAEPGTRLRTMLDVEESTLGWEPSSITDLSRREFIASFKSGHKNGSNENLTGKYFYTTANTDLGPWIVERATGIPTQVAARNILHAIGGENSVYFSTDRTGVPIVGGGLIMTPRDWARYGMLLGSGGMGVTGDMVGGGAKWVKRTMTEGKVSVGMKGWHYVNGVYASDLGFGHLGWGGQWIFADPESETVVAVFAGLMGPNPADLEYGKLLLDASQEIAKYHRAKK